MNRNIRRVRREVDSYIPSNNVNVETEGYLIRRIPKKM